MVKRPLDMSIVSKRRICIEHKKEDNVNVENTLQNIQNANGKDAYRYFVEQFFNNCASYKSAGPVLEQLYNDNEYNLLEQFVTKTKLEIIPMTENSDLNNCISYLESLNIGEINCDKLVNAAKNYKSIDRIIENHNKLSKRFALEQMTSRGRSDRYKCKLICELCDTYDSISPFVKMNIALEEMVYLNYKHGVNIDRKLMVEYVTDYFLLRNNNTSDDIDSYAKCINESKVLSEGDDERVKFLTRKDEPISVFETYTIPTWKQNINAWKLNPDKDITIFENLIEDNIDRINIVENIFSLMEEYCDINQIPYKPDSIFNKISTAQLSGIGARNIMDIMKKYQLNGAKLVDNLKAIWIEDINGSIYADHGDYSGPVSFSSNNIDKFKMKNLISDAQEVGNLLSSMKIAMKEAGVEIIPFFSDTKYINESNFNDYIDSNGYIGVKVGSFYFNPENIEEANNFFESAYNCANNMIYNSNSYCYYVLENDRSDFYVRTKYEVSTSLEEDANRLFTNSEKGAFCEIKSLEERLIKLQEANIDKLISTLKDNKFASRITIDEMKIIVDTIKPIDESNIIPTLVTNIKLESHPNYLRLKSIAENTKFTDCNDPLENINTCNLVLQEGEITNTARLAWEAFRSKTKQVVGKEREICRDMDMTFNHYIKVLDDATHVDRREQIIKGQMIPSISKMLKITIALAGVGLAVGSPFIPAIGAAVALFKNAHMTYKEKKMLFDEIDVELKVLEREIDRAQNASPNKYRQLLTIQRNLEKEKINLQYSLSNKNRGVPLASKMAAQKHAGGEY